MIDRIAERVICDRCGAEVFRRDMHVENLSLFDSFSKEAFVNSVASLEGVAEEVARSWAEHGLYEMCA